MNRIIKSSYETILGIFSIFMLVLNTFVFFVPIFFVSFLKLIPNTSCRNFAAKTLNQLTAMWISFNSFFVDITRTIQWDIEGASNLSVKEWYLVVCNHQTWMDIPVLQKVFNNKIPMLKPFIKSELKWVPLLGFAWWALDCPFMKRYSPEEVKKRPNKKSRDFESTQIACDRFKDFPVSVLSFIEGTRFSEKKHAVQSSPYQNLLKPKAGGVAYVVNSMGKQLHKMLDVTILYPSDHKTLWDYLCGRVNRIKITIKEKNIPNEFRGMNYTGDVSIRNAFYDWINQTWLEKDLRIQKSFSLNPEN